MKLAGAVLLLSLFLVVSLTQGLTVIVKYPEANVGASMSIVGDGCGISWSNYLTLSRVSSNTFQAKLDCNNVPEFQFKLKIGSVWSNGANYKVRMLPGQNHGTVTVYPWFMRDSGAYTYIRGVYSPQLKNTRDVVVYLPPSYFENRMRPSYPTLVMHDGQNLFNASTAFGGVTWGCQETLDTQIMQGNIGEVIVIGVDNTPDRLAEYTYSVDPGYGGGKGNIYLDFLRDTVLPAVKSKYPITSNRQDLGILGSSLGGLISCYAGWTRSSEYSRAGCMSSSFWWNGQDFNFVIMPKGAPRQRINFYLDSGNAGDSQDGYQQTVTVYKHFQSMGFVNNDNLFYYLAEGASHNEYYWGQRFYLPLQDLFPPPFLDPK